MNELKEATDYIKDKISFVKYLLGYPDLSDDHKNKLKIRLNTLKNAYDKCINDLSRCDA